MTEVEKLLAIEEIKRLKSRYFRGLDTKNWDLWHGFGHYHETYLKTEQGWRIQSTRLTRLKVTRRMR